jgi:hypothetical protein
MGIIVLTACHIDAKKDERGGDKKVDINTPVGGLHVSNDVDVRDIGLPIYPGARPVPKDDNNEKSANVNISTSWFGLRVVAQEFESDDPTDKLISYYNGELNKYGKVLRCQTTWHGGDVHVNTGSDKKEDKNPHELTCDKSDGDAVELKVGTEENQHLVAIEPKGRGSKFALVYVRVRDKDTTI